ncbi:methyl-accepting chemotaxis protein [Desulfobaculum sp. SPO524]|uniref:methyl-accepting chemotaxis protein n=1 Tax=Desulfobaculum sp. SPO524 TaxID=3378071 RepID=UPI00385372EB
MLRRLSIGFRIFFVLGVMVLLFAGAIVSFYAISAQLESISVTTVQEKMLKGHKDKIRISTHSMALTLADAVRGLDTEQQKMDAIREMTNDIRFEDDESGYYFAYKGTVPFSVPAKTSVEGKDLSGAKDENGIYYVRELAKKAQAGGGFVEYDFVKPGMGLQPKLAYSEMVPGTNLWLGTGVYVDNVQAEGKQVANALHDEAITQFTRMLITLGVLLLIVVVGCIAIIRSIVRPINGATEAAESIADGQLDVSLKPQGTDEAAKLEEALLIMSRTLKQNMADIEAKTRDAEDKARQAEAATEEANAALETAKRARSEGMLMAATKLEDIVGRLASATAQISAMSEEINNGTMTQQERISTTATAMEEMNATVLEVARNASMAADASREALNRALNGQDVVQHSMTAMNATQTQTEALKTSMTQLQDQAQSIGNIMGVITDIADQTNLLALNAAIEAARAGEAGRGFAVVADEVRKLAEKTMVATKEVGGAISGIQKVAEDNMQSMEDAVSELMKAVDYTNQSGEVLSDIVQSSQSSAEQIQSIATAAEEQSAASEEISTSVDEVNRITTDNARGIAESTQAVRDLADQADGLNRLIEELKNDANQN